MIARVLLWIVGPLSISDRIMLVTYMGSPLIAALPFRQRVAVKLIQLIQIHKPEKDN